MSPLNALKSVCIAITLSDRSKVIMSSFPEFCANGEILHFVSSVKCLGQIISIISNDDASMKPGMCLSGRTFSSQIPRRTNWFMSLVNLDCGPVLATS